jgi:hypothetical protein
MSSNIERPLRRRRGPARLIVPAAWAVVHCSNAQAAFLHGETLDAAANVLAWVVLFLVPIIGITVFWIVHVMPEKIAHRRHHPQTRAIQTLCLLSLVFGGLLWPIAWLWAYTKPVAHKLAYGTDKGDEFFHEAGEKARAGTLVETELAHVKHELDLMKARGALPAEFARLHEDLAALKPSPPVAARHGDDIPVLEPAASATAASETGRRSA